VHCLERPSRYDRSVTGGMLNPTHSLILATFQHIVITALTWDSSRELVQKLKALMWEWIYSICLYNWLCVELFDSSPAAAVALVTSSLGMPPTSRPLLSLAADTKPSMSLSSSLVSPSMRLGDDSHATHLVPRLAPPSTLSMCMFLLHFLTHSGPAYYTYTYTYFDGISKTYFGLYNCKFIYSI